MNINISLYDNTYNINNIRQIKWCFIKIFSKKLKKNEK